MRKTVIALAAATGLVGFGAVGASAALVPPAHVPTQTANTKPADWHTGPRSDSRHSRGEERNEGREHHPSYDNNRSSHDYGGGNNRGSYGYNGGYSR
jgi:hypothetical protein